jgi:hypothetical protein
VYVGKGRGECGNCTVLLSFTCTTSLTFSCPDQSTRRHIPEYLNFHHDRCENFKLSRKSQQFSFSSYPEMLFVSILGFPYEVENTHLSGGGGVARVILCFSCEGG